jgi:hypothetical protein
VELLDRIQSSLDPAVGPLLRVALVRFAPRPDRLAVVAHRLVADPPSMRLILEYLETAVVQLSAGEELRTLPKTTSWQSWCRRLNTFATSDAVQAEREYWAQVVDAAAGALPYDLPTGPDYGVEATTRTLTVSLDRPETDILVRTGTAASGTAPAGADDGVAKVLLAALARTLSPWSGAVRHVIDLERHDRESLFEDVDLARTVGWFSRTHPIALTCEPGATPGATLEVVAEQLRSVPHAGIGWQLLRQTGDLAQPSPAGLAFTYLGAEFRPVTGTFSVLDRPVGRDRSPNARRPYAIEVVSAVTGGRLVVHWRYSETPASGGDRARARRRAPGRATRADWPGRPGAVRLPARPAGPGAAVPVAGLALEWRDVGRGDNVDTRLRRLDPHRIAEFWALALGYISEPGYANDHGASHCGPRRQGPGHRLPAGARGQDGEEPHAH